MPRVSDSRGKPGEIVLVRGGQPVNVWETPGIDKPRRVGVVMPKGLGVIIGVNERAWTYVLWSMPRVIGWVPDGVLRTVRSE